ncbi:MAG TPA: TolC family protein [Armatimonadota bacterium]|jgi:outer membrane protein TolC
MLKRIALIGAALVICGSLRAQDVKTAPAAPGDAVMTVDDAVALALKNNELVALSESAERKAHAKIHEAAANALPQVKVSASFLRQKEVSASIPTKYDANGVPIGFATFTLNPATSKTSNAVATQLVDIWGSVRRAKTIASLSNRIAALSVLRSKSEVVYQTRTSFYNVLRAQGAMDVAQAAVTEAEEQLRLADAFVKAGTSPEFDVMRAKVTLADRQQALIVAKDSVSLAGAALNNVLGRDVSTPLNLAPENGVPTGDVDIAAQTQKALDSRPEVIQAGLGIRANHEAVGIYKAGNLPQVSLSGVYSYNWTASGLSSEKANWNYGVNVSWPLWDSGLTKAKVAEAKEDLKTSELQRDQLLRGVALEVRQWGLRVQETADRFTVGDKSVSVAEEALRLAKVRYQNGVATQLEVTDAETALTSARFNRINALYDHLSARAAFDATVMGRVQSAAGTAQ